MPFVHILLSDEMCCNDGSIICTPVRMAWRGREDNILFLVSPLCHCGSGATLL